MGFILLGHGTIEVGSMATEQRMEYVAIPTGTTIQFYTDAGQGLFVGPGDVDAWEQVEAPWPALDSSNVTFNMSLWTSVGIDAPTLRNNPAFGGHELIRPGIGDIPDPLHLCTGTPESCPTSPSQIAEGMTHDCDGVLGREDLSGELHWLACASIVTADQETQDVVDAALEDMPAAVLVGHDPHDFPELQDRDVRALCMNNRIAVDASAGLDTTKLIHYVVSGQAVMLFSSEIDRHPNRFKNYAQFFRDYQRGSVTFWREHKQAPPYRYEFKGVDQDYQRDLVRIYIEEMYPGIAVEIDFV